MNTPVNEYHQQASDFLKSTGTKYEIVYIGKGKHFADDTQSRDRYQVTLSNSKGSYSFDFGDSIYNTEKYDNALATRRNKGKDKWQQPHAYDVLANLISYEPGSFDNFCGDFGYDEDSRKALEVYLAVQKEWDGINKLFNSEQLELLAEIQ